MWPMPWKSESNPQTYRDFFSDLYFLKSVYFFVCSNRNLTLQNMSIPVSDILQAYRNTPEKMEEALQKVSSHLQCYRKPGEQMMKRYN